MYIYVFASAMSTCGAGDLLAPICHVQNADERLSYHLVLMCECSSIVSADSVKISQVPLWIGAAECQRREKRKEQKKMEIKKKHGRCINLAGGTPT